MIKKFTALLTLLWLPSLLSQWNSLDNFFIWRHQLTLYSGLLGFGYMGLAVLLAARFRWVETIVKGLDKGYKLHRDLGIATLVTLFAHWLIIKSGKWLVGAGILERPQRAARAAIEGINWHELANQVGDISFKFLVIFCIISLVQAISYKKFKYTHKVGGLLMLAGIFHSVFIVQWKLETLPMNLAIAVISVIGFSCSLLSLTGSIGRRNQVLGKVIKVERHSVKDQQIMAVRFAIQLNSPINYKEGQFAYLNFHDKEAPHPFSVLNYDQEQQVIEFAVKDLGDYTHHLVQHLQTGQAVTVEGAYGAFQIPAAATQVWVGAGIGIVPFVSRLYWLKVKAKKQPLALKKVHLFYCVNSQQEAFFHKEIVKLLQSLSFIELHLVNAEKNQMLSSQQIFETVAQQDFDLSFCGPQKFGEGLQASLAHKGFPANRFHSERFNMR